MRLYTKQHQFYCGIDLHARSMYLCILNQAGDIVLHRNMKAIHGGQATNDTIDAHKIATVGVRVLFLRSVNERIHRGCPHAFLAGRILK